MRVWKTAVMVCAAVTLGNAQSLVPPIEDTRLTVHTLVREDVFSGFLDDNMTRFERGERNIAALIESRPDQRANLLAWKAGTEVYRAVLASEAGKEAEFEKMFAAARRDFADAAKLATGSDGVPAITGGTYALFADRLPAQYRAAAWQQAYDSYSLLWNAQKAQIEQMPSHFKGEVLAGMAQSAQRTGRAEESAQFVEKIVTLLAGTPFEETAAQWKKNPASAATSNLTCKNCHAPGRLGAKLAALDKK